MTTPDLETVRKLLEDPLRLAFLARLTAGSMQTTHALADGIGATLAALRYHLAQLREAEAIITEVHDGRHHHRLADAGIARIVRPCAKPTDSTLWKACCAATSIRAGRWAPRSGSRSRHGRHGYGLFDRPRCLRPSGRHPGQDAHQPLAETRLDYARPGRSHHPAYRAGPHRLRQPVRHPGLENPAEPILSEGYFDRIPSGVCPGPRSGG